MRLECPKKFWKALKRMNVGKVRKQGHDLLQVYDEGGVVRSGKEALKYGELILLESWGVMIMRTPSWMTLIQEKTWIYQSVVIAYVNLSQKKRYHEHLMWLRRTQHLGSLG